ncbi:hypothetical protein AB0H28_09755 [Micromonospora sp. NPDC050980]|uniref:hypothetical protein n=1 Tax=Micromonospora sp. NPDC050980 TaxID=3155161 RepID=UPI0033FE4A93
MQRINVPLTVRPSAPSGAQKAPGWTLPFVVPLDDFVVRGALAVRFGAGLAVVRFGLGVGFAVAVRVVGRGDRVAGGADGGSVVAATDGEPDGETDGEGASAGPASRVVAGAAETSAAGFPSDEPPTAASPPPQQQSTTTPADTTAIFAPPESRCHRDCVVGRADPARFGADGCVTRFSLLVFRILASGQPSAP